MHFPKNENCIFYFTTKFFKLMKLDKKNYLCCLEFGRQKKTSSDFTKEALRGFKKNLLVHAAHAVGEL